MIRIYERKNYSKEDADTRRRNEESQEGASWPRGSGFGIAKREKEESPSDSSKSGQADDHEVDNLTEEYRNLTEDETALVSIIDDCIIKAEHWIPLPKGMSIRHQIWCCQELLDAFEEHDIAGLHKEDNGITISPLQSNTETTRTGIDPPAIVWSSKRMPSINVHK